MESIKYIMSTEPLQRMDSTNPLFMQQNQYERSYTFSTQDPPPRPPRPPRRSTSIYPYFPETDQKHSSSNKKEGKEEEKEEEKEDTDEKDNKEEQNEIDEKEIKMLYEPYTNWFCCTRYKDRSKFQNMLQTMDLSPIQKQIIQTRYLNILENFQGRARNYGIMFYIGHIVITVGSLFVPALLSIQNSDKSYVYENGNFTVHIYWATFILSLLVTIFNAILTLFKIDKKYYFLNTTLERLRSEGWQYFGLTGRYSGQLLKNRNQRPTYRNQFVYFSHYIEKIKMKQVEEEYYKTDEKTAQTPNGNHITAQPTKTELYPPSPDLPIHSMNADVPEPVKEVVSSLVKSHKTVEETIDPTLINMPQTVDLRNEASYLPSSPERPVQRYVQQMRAQIKPSAKELIHPSRAKPSTLTPIPSDDSDDSRV